nr:f-box/kelch-repeat protein [Quercus suber]
MLTTNEELPEDLVIQILLWLPVMSLLRLKCVCRSWCDLISGQNFITKHLLHNQTTSNKNMNVGFLLLWREKTSHNYVFSKLPYETLEISSTQAVPSSYLGTDDKTDKFDIVGSSNGLVCLRVHDSLNIILWNPATKETKVVPHSQISYPQGKAFPQDLGFGFDIKSNEYKVVMILENYDHPELPFYERKRFSVAETSIRALPFVPSRKAVLSVPGFYKTKLGVSSKSGIHEVGSRTESVKVNHKAQVMAHGPAVVLNIMNPRDTVIEQLMDEAVNLDAPEVTHIVGKRIKGVINVSLSTPQFSGNHNTENQGADFSAKEFDARINEIDSEMGKFDHINCMTQPSNISQDILGEAREKQVLAKP